MAEQLTAVVSREGSEYSVVLLYPHVASQGKTIEEVKENIADAFRVLMEVIKEQPEEGKGSPNLESDPTIKISELERALASGNAIVQGTVQVYQVDGPSFMPRDYNIRIVESDTFFKDFLTPFSA